MVEWYWLLVAFYLGLSAGMWFIMTIRDGHPFENLMVLLWPIFLLGFIAAQ